MSVNAPPPPAQQQPPPSQHALLAAIVLVLAAGAPAAVTASTLAALLAPIGITATATASALSLLGPLAPAGPGPAQAFTRSAGYVHRAAYLLNAAQRLTAGGSVQTEVRYARQHLAAHKARAGAATTVDVVVAEHGLVLGWRTQQDSRVEEHCADLDGTNFQVWAPPIIDGARVLPGQAHGGQCRCIARAPFADESGP